MTASNWSSILFTTYSISLSFLEAVPLAAVNSSFKNFTVLADIEGYLSSLSDVGAIGVGRYYDLVPIKITNGVFHPKVSLLADEAGNIRATIGSGNLSFGGWGYNNEVLEVLRPGRDSRCFSDIADMLEAITSESMSGGRLECLRAPGLEQYIELARKASATPGDGKSRMLHTMGGSLVPQIREMADDLGGARRIAVVSPFFSSHHGISALAEGLDCDDISVAVPIVAPSIFDFKSASSACAVYKPVTSDYFEDSRSLHSKLYDIECANGRLVVTGSANATTAALLGQNVEAVVARPVNLALTFGWRATARTDSRSTEEREPLQTSGAGLVVDYNGGVIFGRVMGYSAGGDWEAFLSSGTRRQSAGIVKVDDNGAFRFDPPTSMDPIALGSAAQVIFIRGETELRGWLVLRDLIKEVSRRGPIARAIGRLMSGLDTLGDVGTILDYFARDPMVLFDTSERTGGGRIDRRDTIAALGGDLAALRGTSALDMASKWSISNGGNSGDALIDALVRHLANALPDSNDDGADDDDDYVDLATSPSAASRNKNNAPRQTPRLRQSIVKRAFEQLFNKLEEHPAGSARAPGLFILFDMMIQIVPRTETPDELLPILLQKWLSAAANARPTDTDPTALDQCMAIIATRIVIGDPAQAGKMHAVLQSWLRGALDDDFKLLFEPSVRGIEERRIHPNGLEEEWKLAWSLIVGSRTQWSVLNDLRNALASGSRDIVMPDGASPAEWAAIRKIADGTGRPDKIAYLTTKRPGVVGCPKCHTGLPAEQRARLVKNRIATCTGSLRCRRIIIDVSL
ncbi:hypothetical protein [Hoeflea sp.]|uniref:hypothetical protein n=1 Tax=Hoeflea sp. TaxID=1940281 RepID=UPI003A905D27